MGWATALVAASPGSGIETWLVVVLFIIFALVKEFVLDLTWLEHDTIQGSVTDFVTYCAGIVIGLIALENFWYAFALAVLMLLLLAVMDYFNKLPTYPRKGEIHGAQDS